MKTFKEFQNIIEGYKEPNIQRMRMKAQYHNNMAGTLGYAMNPLNREKQNLYRGRKNFVSRYDSNAPKAYHRDNKTGKVQRGADINDLESIHRYEKRQSKLLKNRFDRHSRSAKNIQAKIDQHQNDPLSYMSRAMGGPHADDNMDMKRRPAKKKVQEAYKEPNLERMQRQAEKHSKDLKSGKEHYSREAKATRGDMENIYKGKKNTEIYKNKPRGYSDRYTRHPDPNDLMSQQLALKHTKKVNVDQPQRRAQNIRAKIQQHQNDPLGYMSKTFGGPHIDTGMDMKRRPRKRK